MSKKGMGEAVERRGGDRIAPMASGRCFGEEGRPFAGFSSPMNRALYHDNKLPLRECLDNY